MPSDQTSIRVEINSVQVDDRTMDTGPGWYNTWVLDTAAIVRELGRPIHAADCITIHLQHHPGGRP